MYGKGQDFTFRGHFNVTLHFGVLFLFFLGIHVSFAFVFCACDLVLHIEILKLIVHFFPPFYLYLT